MNKKMVQLYLAALVMVALTEPVSADAVDFTSLTGAVDLSTVTTAVLAVAALLVVPKIAMRGARMVLGFIGR